MLYFLSIGFPQLTKNLTSSELDWVAALFKFYNTPLAKVCLDTLRGYVSYALSAD